MNMVITFIRINIENTTGILSHETITTLGIQKDGTIKVERNYDFCLSGK